MNKLITAIRSFRERARLAWMVFRENPDEVVTLTQTERGSVEFRNRFGMGIAGNHRTALEGVAEQYGIFAGQPGMSDDGDERFHGTGMIRRGDGSDGDSDD